MTVTRSIVWATFWIIFQLGSLAGFALLGIYAFKVLTLTLKSSWFTNLVSQLTPEEMDAQAGLWLFVIPTHLIESLPLVAGFLPT